MASISYRYQSKIASEQVVLLTQPPAGHLKAIIVQAGICFMLLRSEYKYLIDATDDVYQHHRIVCKV